jgi:hypothetical protein
MKLVLAAFLLLLPMTITFWAIVHVLTKAEFQNPLVRFAWLGVVTLLPVVGALIYLVAGKPEKALPQAQKVPGES